MAATSVFVDGRRINIPGVYSRLDPTGLETQGLTSAGIVALIGTGKGTLPPVSAIDDGEALANEALISRPSAARAILTAGALLDASRFTFEPSLDEAIQGGSQQQFLLRVDPSTQSTLTLNDASANPVIDLATREYGADSTQVNVQIQNGTTQGKLILINSGDVTETLDDVGGDTLFTLEYAEPTGTGEANGWDTMTAVVDASGITCAATRTETGATAQAPDATPDAGVASVVSSSAADTAVQVEIYGVSGSGFTKERLTLDGTTPVTGTTAWDASEILGIAIVGTTAAVGTISVRDGVGDTVIFTIPPASFANGGERAKAMFVAGTALTVACSAGTEVVQIFGTRTNGSFAGEELTATTSGVATTVTDWRSIEFIGLSQVTNGVDITISGTAASTTHTAQNSLSKVADAFNALQVPNATTPASPFGFRFTFQSGLTSLDPAQLDFTVSPVNIDSPASGSFTADLFFVVDGITAGSRLVTATRRSGAGQPPANLGSATFLTGGIDGTPTTADYTKAFDLLTQVFANTIVPLTTDAGVHEQARAHAAYMGGIGRKERDVVVGLKGVASLATKAEIKSKIVAINSRHVRAVGQSVDRFDVDLVRTTYDPQFLAAIVAGMQAGSPVGEPLTFKLANVLGFSQSNTWDPVNDAAELIDAGFLFLENVDGVGRRIVRNVTTILGSSNIAFIEASANEAVNFTTFNVRASLESVVGQKGLDRTVNQARGNIIATTGALVRQEVLAAAAQPELELIFDVLEVALPVAPVLPINFVVPTIHLSTAAAIEGTA